MPISLPEWENDVIFSRRQACIQSEVGPRKSSYGSGCAYTQLKTFNWGWTPLTHSGYTSALIHGVKEIQSSFWPAVSQLIITNDAWERDFAGIQHSSRIFIGWRGHICLIFLVRVLTLYRVAQKTGTLFVRFICIRLNFIKYWQIFKFIFLSKSEEHL